MIAYVSYLTVRETAEALGVTPGEVDDLIRIGELPSAVHGNHSERLISRAAVEIYARHRLRGGPRREDRGAAGAGKDRLGEFERDTGLTPKEWQRRWDAGDLDQTAANMALSVRATGLLLTEARG
jgi:excisionase family DNA binding protein